MSDLCNRTNFKKIVIHHMGDGLDPMVDIRKRWNPFNYEFPEYDYGIQGDGVVLIGRPLVYVGAHTQADISKYNYGPNWWNRNTLSIGLAGDFTKYKMSCLQFGSLVALVKRLMVLPAAKLTLDDVYPHGQVARTLCPGCSYDKLQNVTGFKGWNYNEFERAVLLK
jgi:hypothetical protein